MLCVQNNQKAQRKKRMAENNKPITICQEKETKSPIKTKIEFLVCMLEPFPISCFNHRLYYNCAILEGKIPVGIKAICKGQVSNLHFFASIGNKALSRISAFSVFMVDLYCMVSDVIAYYLFRLDPVSLMQCFFVQMSIGSS